MINISKRNWNNIQNTWKGMPMILRIPLIFTLHFASIAKTTKKNIKYQYKHFSDCLSYQTSKTIFLQRTDKEEIANIISSLDSNKASCPNSIPYRTLFLLKK